VTVLTAKPQRYDVHLFGLIRVTVPSVEAASCREAIERASWQLIADDFFEHWADEDLHLSDEWSHAIVQRSGQGEAGRTLYAANDPLLAPLRRLVAWYDAELGTDAEMEQIVVQARQLLGDTF